MDNWLGSTVVATVIASAVAVVTSWRMMRFERNRWYAHFFIAPKLEALRALHAALVDGHYAINFRAAAQPQTRAEFEEHVQAPEQRYLQAFVRAKIYLDEDTIEEMGRVLGAMRQMTRVIWLRLPASEFPAGVKPDRYEEDAQPDWNLFTETFDAAEQRLGTLLSPEKVFALFGKGLHGPPAVESPRRKRN